MERLPKTNSREIKETPTNPQTQRRIGDYDKSNGIGQNPPPNSTKPGFPESR